MNVIKRYAKALVSVITGNAVVITRGKKANKADVIVGKSLSKDFVVNSMVGTVKALML